MMRGRGGGEEISGVFEEATAACHSNYWTEMNHDMDLACSRSMEALQEDKAFWLLSH